ncbi:MAG: glutamate 5-kinase [Sandaracinaceae bacterium]|jgi:glutamate 5-kinase|nr:glutamate 5-kinase [Sandaracinaceae bacterium]
MNAGEKREALKEARRIVVKIGSRSLTRASDASQGRFAAVAAQIAKQHAAGRSVVLVSSGAIAMGYERLGLNARPTQMALLQASAAAGQSGLMRAYEEAFAVHGIHIAQILLTHADLADRDRYLNARAALEALLEYRVVPIINENDTVSVEEIKFGDNDQLASMVSTLSGAELLILLTDVEGVLDGAGARVSVVEDVAQARAFVKASSSDLGTGGMGSKINAAENATKHGVPVVIADARDASILEKVLNGDDVGTLFMPGGSRLASRKHWIGYTLKPKGGVLIDEGAARALGEGKRSLLPAGVVGVRGDFEAGDAISIVAPDGREIARGLTRYATRDVSRLAGAKTAEIEARLGRAGADEIVHRDDLVVLA